MSVAEQTTIAIPFKGRELAVSVALRIHSDVWIVGLHGIQANKALYRDLFNQEFASNYSQLAIDFIGFGNSDKPDDFSYAIEDQAAVVQHVLDQLNIKHMHLIGHSLGGMVGTLLLERLGDRILSFANLEGNLVYADCGASKDVVKFSLEEFEATGYDQLRSSIKQSTEPSAAARTKWLTAISANTFYKTSESIVAWSKSEKQRSLFNDSTTRRLFMFGSQNAHKAEIVSETVQKVEIPDTGHFMLLDQPNACYQALSGFIAE